MFNSKRTPTSFIGASHENIPHTLQVSSFVGMKPHQKSKDKNLKMMANQSMMQQLADMPTTIAKNQIQMGHHMNFATNPVVTGSTSKGNNAGHLHQRTGSQLSSHTNQLMLLNESTSHSTVANINRKSSIEAKIGGQAAVIGVIKQELGEGGQPIRSKAQYDNWLQMQLMKKATGGATNVRSQSSNNT